MKSFMLLSFLFLFNLIHAEPVYVLEDNKVFILDKYESENETENNQEKPTEVAIVDLTDGSVFIVNNGYDVSSEIKIDNQKYILEIKVRILDKIYLYVTDEMELTEKIKSMCSNKNTGNNPIFYNEISTIGDYTLRK